jgi:hypothetical protein
MLLPRLLRARLLLLPQGRRGVRVREDLGEAGILSILTNCGIELPSSEVASEAPDKYSLLTASSAADSTWTRPRGLRSFSLLPAEAGLPASGDNKRARASERQTQEMERSFSFTQSFRFEGFMD